MILHPIKQCYKILDKENGAWCIFRWAMRSHTRAIQLIAYQTMAQLTQLHISNIIGKQFI